MKRVFTLALAFALLMNLAISASAATRSVAATPEDLLPELVSATCEELILYTPDEFGELSDEVNETIEDGKDSLPDAIPEGMRARLMFYADVCDECAECSAIFMPHYGWEPIVMQYVDGEWVRLDVVVNEDGTIKVNAIKDGLVVFMTCTNPFLITSSCEHAEIYPEDEVEDLGWKTRNIMNVAKRAINEISHEGLLVRSFFYLDICESCDIATAVFQTFEFNELIIMQHVDGEWIKLEFAVNEEDGTVTVEGVVDGPMVFFAK